MIMTSKPIENSYWVIPEKFLAAEYPRTLAEDTSILKLTSIIQTGTTCFIDLTEEDEGLLSYTELLEKLGFDNSQHNRFSIPDISIPESPELVIEILDLIDSVLDNNGKIYLHCYGGIGRTGTIVGCWLSRHGHKGKTALDRLHTLWQDNPKSAYISSPESKEQENYIIQWSE